MIVVALSSIAHAEPGRVEVGAGVASGLLDAGATSDIAFGAEGRLAFRRGPLVVLARGAWLGLAKPGTGRTGPEDGHVVRVGGDVRFTVAHDGTGRRRDDLWIGAGLGREIGWWNTSGGGGFDRFDTSVGLGYTLSNVLGSSGASHDDVDFAVEVLRAHPPTSRMDPTLTGAIDHSVVVSMTFSFGP